MLCVQGCVLCMLCELFSGCPPKLSKVVQRLTAIKPPDLITRVPRSIRERSYWKATEWKHWLLYYSLPCCIQILPHQYWSHFALLVAAVFTLLSDRLTTADIAYAGMLYSNFFIELLLVRIAKHENAYVKFNFWFWSLQCFISIALQFILTFISHRKYVAELFRKG